MVSSQIEAEKMTGGTFARIFSGVVSFGFRIEDGGFVIVAVTGVEVPVFEFFDFRQFVFQVVGEVGFCPVVDALEVGKTAWAFEAFEKMADADSLAVIFAVGLEKIVAGLCGADAAGNSELKVF